jgi:hypothetical protein
LAESQFYLSVTDFDNQPTQGELGKPQRYVLRYLAKNHILPALGEINLAELDPSSI